jgi:hypothetical protein
VPKAQRWPWSSIGKKPRDVERPELDAGAVVRGADWLRWENERGTEAELEALRESVRQGRPFGSASW